VDLQQALASAGSAASRAPWGNHYRAGHAWSYWWHGNPQRRVSASRCFRNRREV